MKISTCNYESCSREIPLVDVSASKKGVWFTGFCNRYCKEAHERGITKVDMFTLTGHSRHKNHLVYPPITIDCDYCQQPYDIQYGKDKRNYQVLCSRKCFGEILKQNPKKAFPKYLILHWIREATINQHYANIGITASQLTIKFKGYPNYNINNRSIGGMLKLYKARGIVIAHEIAPNTVAYTINLDLLKEKPLAKWV